MTKKKTKLVNMNKYLLWLIILGVCCSCNMSTPKTGFKIGRIVKLADEGLIYKTCEGELIRGGLVDSSGSLGGSFHFVIENPILKLEAQKALEEQYEVIIHYETPLFSSITRSESHDPHFVVSIQRK